jgi:hypothetical protein
LTSAVRAGIAGLLLGAMVLLVAACAADDSGGAVAAGGPTTEAVPVDVALVVDISDGTSAPPRHGSITCQGAAAIGTGFLLDPTVASAACAVLEADASVQRRLTDGPAKGLACTQQYGGPETATITGTLLGKSVKADLHRKDGCGVADWNALRAVLGAS